METGKKRLNGKGVTLIELMVVLAIVGILMVVGAFQYQGWVSRYRVEGEVKQMYTDLMRARSLAITRGKMHFINVPDFDVKRYRVFEDSFGGPEGNRKLEAADAEVTSVETTSTLMPSSRNLAINTKGMIINGTGILLKPEYVRFVPDSSVDPDYDCIVLAATRVNMGAWDGTECVEK